MNFNFNEFKNTYKNCDALMECDLRIPENLVCKDVNTMLD